MERNNSEIIIYQTDDGTTRIDVRLEENSVWLAQNDLVALFQSSKSNISEHIKHIFQEGELNQTAVVRKFRTTGPDGKNYHVAVYDGFIKMSRQNLLTDAGKISADLAEKKALAEYTAYKQKTLDELSPVEKHFLAAIESAEKKLKHNRKDK